jgi:4-aminobutyrate aminotransferase / (S)-3-amino-2-methylpropionate transaminase / 5-aminovalerate transaminase
VSCWPASAAWCRPASAPFCPCSTRIAKRCHADGLLVLTAGSYGNVMWFLPPLSISDALLEEGLTILGEAIAKETVCAA